MYAQKLKALELLNLGHSQKEISQLTRVTEKTIGVWVKNWREQDLQKKKTVDSLWRLLDRFSKLDNPQIAKIEKLAKSIKLLQNELLIKSKFQNL